jgi:tetratricopeptide (TPR) repeat protein
VIRKWSFRNPNLYLRPINHILFLSPNARKRIKVGRTRTSKKEIFIKKRAFSLEKEALSASGIGDRNKIAKYIDKLDHLCQKFIHEVLPPSDPHPSDPLPSNPMIRAKMLFDWLWKEKPGRYKLQGNFKLGDAIDAQLTPDTETVGNCLGLTILYNCLLRRMGIVAEALYLEDAFGMGPHVLTRLQVKEAMVDIENMFPEGFDYKGHLHHPSRTKWGDKELVADIHHSMGNEFFSKGEWIKALENYDRAIYLNPRYEKAHINKVILIDKMKKEV